MKLRSQATPLLPEQPALDNEALFAMDGLDALRSVSPEYAKLFDKHQELHAEKELLRKELSELAKDATPDVQMWAQNNIIVVAAAHEEENKPPRMVGPSKKVAELLGEFAPPPVPAAPLAFHEPLASRKMREKSKRIGALDEAIALIGPQLTKAHLDGSARLCALLKPRYDQIAERICAALVELGSADLEQRAFMLKYRNAARSTLRVVHATGSLGDPSDPFSEIRRLLDWAEECGHFDRSGLPAEWGTRRSAAGSVRSFPVGN